jgi:hypothetical protein
MATKPGASSKERRLTPLWIVSLFVSFTELVLGTAVTQTMGGVQVALAAFVIFFPLLVASAFFAILWSRPWVFYSPSEYGGIDPAMFVETLARAQFGKVTTKTADLPQDVKVVGNPDHFVLLFKAAGKTWKKSTKAMGVGAGCLLQVSTEQLSPDGSISIAEAVTFVPDAIIADDEQGDGKHIVAPRLAQ